MSQNLESFLSIYGTAMLILAGTMFIAFIWDRLFGRFIRSSVKIIQNDPTNYKFFKRAITALIYIVGFSWAVYSIETMRTIANTLLTGAGILAVTVGFASQHALSNIISGLFIVMFKPFRVNDRVIIRDTLAGTIEDITLRHTVIKDFQNRRIVIPNAIISNEVIINSDINDHRINRWIDFDISYDSDIDLAKNIIREEIQNHPLHIDGRTEDQIQEGAPLIPVRLIEFTDSSVKIRAWAWANNMKEAYEMHTNVNETIKKRFDLEGIEIPFPHRTIVYKSDILKERLKG